MAIALKPAVAADWDRAWAIQREAFLDLVTRTWGGWTPEQVQKCAAEWAPESTRLVFVDDVLAGWIRLEHHPTHDWLDLVVVGPAHQRRGIGREVMEVVMAEAAARGVPLWLSVYRTNEARRLYARFGFAEIPRDDIRVFMVWPPTTDPATRPR